MADLLAPDNLLTVVDQARQRVRERAQEALRREVSGLPASSRGAPSPLSRPTALPIPELAKDHPVSIRLPNGRRLRAVLGPGVARRSDLAAIAKAIGDNNSRAFGALQTQGAAIDGLKRAQEELGEKIARLESRADAAVLAMNETFTQSSRRLKQLAAQGQKVLTEAGGAATAAVGQLKQVQALAVTQQTQNLTNVIGTAQATAYGERGSVLATNNVILTGNQLFWTFLAPVSMALGASAGTAMLLGALAPLASLLTGYAAVGSRLPERRQQRFITGVSFFDLNTTIIRVPLRDRFTDDALFQEFRHRVDVPVTATLVDSANFESRFLFARVIEGDLFLAFRSRPPVAMKVAWMVDTGAQDG